MGRRYAPARYRELGTELRKRREAAGLTSAEVADYCGWSMTTISRIETGQRAIEPVDAIVYLGGCKLYRPDIGDMVELCREAEQTRGFWLSPQGEWIEDSLSSLTYHESAADRSIIYQPQLVHGLLQTSDYARARIGAERWRTEDDVERCVRIRMDRQGILNVPSPASFTFFLHEQALRLKVGSAPIMQEQLLQIVFTTALSHVTVRVVQASKREPFAFGGPFHLLERDNYAPLVYLDNHATGLFLEDPEFVGPYGALVSAIADVALDEGQSRELIATMANEYDLGSMRDASDGVEEEQPER